MIEKIGGVIVSFNPNMEHLNKVLSSAIQQLDSVVIVNNGAVPLKLDISFAKHNQLTVVENHFNKGIASALNIGLKSLIDNGYNYFLMLDQDSVLIEGTAVALLKAHKELTAHGEKVAATGATYFNSRLNKHAPFVKYGILFLRKFFVQHSLSHSVETHLLITSGTLLNLEALNEVGYMQDDLFIDYVDAEWCLRAISKGYKLYGCFDAKMIHELGDQSLNFFGLLFPMHSPLRHYYLSRNAILLTKKKYIPINWRFIILYRMLILFVFYSVVPSNRNAHFKMMLRGVYHGVAGISGQYR